MKKFYIIGMAMIIAVAISSCRSEKDFGDSYKKPCYEESISTAAYFREIGYGIDSDLDKSSEKAIEQAKTKMKLRLKTEYKNYVSEHHIASSMSEENLNRMEKDFMDGVEGVLGRADNPCYDYYKNKKENKWYYFYVLSVDKHDVDGLIDEVLHKK